jgi:hypothetical protein
MLKRKRKTIPRLKRRGKSTHPLALILRILDRRQKTDCKSVFGYSRWTIKSIIVGTLNFSHRAARRISERTNVAMEWLLAGDGTVPPFTRDGKPFTPDSYRAYQMQRNNPTVTINKPNALNLFPFIVIRVARLMAAAASAGKSSEAKWQLYEAINSMSVEFPDFKKQGHDFEMSIVSRLIQPQKGRGFDFMNPIHAHLEQAVNSRR